VSSLLRELDADLPAATPVTVLVPAVIVADGARPQLARTVDWRVAPLAGTPEANRTVNADAFTFAVRHAPENEPALRYLRAAARAWRTEDASPEVDIAGTEAPLAADTARLVWLAPGDLPATVREWIAAGGHALIDAQTTWPQPEAGVVAWRDDEGRVLARATASGRGRVTQLQQALAPADLPALLEADFPQRLRELLDGPPTSPRLADAAEHAPLVGGPGFPESPRELDTPLLWLILALFALERGFATRARPEAKA
jgi:hypothetical protein